MTGSRWWRWLASLVVVGLLAVVGAALAARPDKAPHETQLTSASDVPVDPALDLYSIEMQGWLSDPSCPRPAFEPDFGNFEMGGPAWLDSVQVAWGILTHSCTANSPGLPAFFYEIPVGTIVRDPDNGRSLLVTLQGWKHIPTGGDYLCFVNQGHPVLNLPRVTELTLGTDAGDLPCVVPPPPAAAPAPQPAPIPTPAPAPQRTPAPEAAPVPEAETSPAPEATPAPEALPAPEPTPSPAPDPALTPAPMTWAETTGGVAHTWTNYTNAGGTEGPTIGSNQTVQIACKIVGFQVSNGNTWWYRIASPPWNGQYYVSADAFYNNGATSGSLVGTPWVDDAVADC